MKPLLCFISFSLFFLFIHSPLYAQKTSVEKIKESCQNLAFEDRLSVTVARFSVSTPKAQGEFGGELATMLSNALQESACFRVLESIKNLDDLTGEIGLGLNGYTNGVSSPQSGKMIGAQMVITGEVTEYNEGRVGASIAGIGFGTNKASVGFILKVINPQTREIVFSKSIDMSSNAPGFTGARLFGFKIAGGNFRNKAIADACEFAIIKAVEILSEEKDNIPVPEVDSSLSTSEIRATNVNFNKVNMLYQLLKSNINIKTIDKTFSNGEALFRLTHKGTIDELLENLASKAGGQFEVIGWEAHQLSLKMN